VRVIESVEDFEALRDVWNKVLQRALDNDVFSTWEWLWCWWKHFGENRKLRILVGEEDGEIVGFAPFMLSKYNFSKLGKLSRIEFIGFPHADYNNILLLKRDLNCLKLFMEKLEQFFDWDLLDLRDIRGESFSGQALQILAHSRSEHSKLRVGDGTLCPHVVLSNLTIDDFVKRLSSNMRRQLRKNMRRLSENFKVEFKTQRYFSSVDEAMKVFFKLHEERWKSRGREGAFAREDFRNFHLDVAKVFEEKGWLGLHFLTVNDETVAADYTFDYNLKTYSYLTGFDPKFRRFGVTNLLRMHLIEECVKKDFKEYDLTRDFEPYKADWATGVRKNLVARLTRKGLFAKIYCWSLENSFARWLSSKVGAHLTFRHG
jgi:CelD/BcsL family acetyltransferase involved in cellulose biosynthesis